MNEEPKVKMPKKFQKRLIIEGDYTAAIANDVAKLAEHLNIPQKVLRGWFHSEHWPALGWLSYPVSKDHYKVLLVIANNLWCNEKLIRIQLGEKSQARRDHILRGAGLSWIEQVVLEDVLKRKCLGQKRYLTWAYYISCLRGRYPEGYRQLNGATFIKMKKKAGDLMRYAQKNGQFDRLLASLGLAMVDGKVIPSAASRLIKADEQIPSGHAVENTAQRNQPAKHFVDPRQADEEAYARMRDAVMSMLSAGNEELASLLIGQKYRGTGLIEELKKELAVEQADEKKKRLIENSEIMAWYLSDANRVSQAEDCTLGVPPDPDGQKN